MKHFKQDKLNIWVKAIDLIIGGLCLAILSPAMLAIFCYRCVCKSQAIEKVFIYSTENRIITLYQFHHESSLGLSPRLINLLKGDIGILGAPLHFSIEPAPNLKIKPGLLSLEDQLDALGITAAAPNVAKSSATKSKQQPDVLYQTMASPKHYLKSLIKALLVKVITLNCMRKATPETVPLFKLDIHNVTMNQLVDQIAQQINEHPNNRLAPLQYAFINADCINQTYNNQDYFHTLKQCDYILGDGTGVRIAAQWLGYRLKANLNGTDLFPQLCERLGQLKQGIFLLGGQIGVAEQAANNMQKRYPELVVSGTHDGFFNEAQTEQVIKQINNSGAKVLLVAMGAPKQEQWLAKHKHKLNVAITLGVGGLFDFYSYRISRAPLWLRQIGMEWIWRLIQEPKRMWRRYIIGNPLFVYRSLTQAIAQQLRGNTAPTSKPVFQHHLLADTTSHNRFNVWIQSCKPIIKRIAKRSLDICLSATLLLLLMPFLLLVALVIRLESPGAVLYSQQRAGKNNQAFTMWKFRSMYTDAEARLEQLKQQNEMQGGVLFKMKQDPRITKVGKFIRKASIDELPQLWNVLKGEMSLVGPRPALLTEVEQYRLKDRRRLKVKPGITCIWQVSGRSDIPFDRQVELDVDYIYQQSLTADIYLLVKTIPAVLLARGAY